MPASPTRLAPDGLVADALRRSALHRSMGKFVPRAMLGVEVANEITGSTQAGSPDVITVVMFQDIGDSRICNLGSAAVIYGWLLWVPPVGWWSMCRWPMLLWTRQTESTEAISR